MATQQERRTKYMQALTNPFVRQLLNGIGHTESGNRYNIRYSGERGGAKFDLTQPAGHPNIPAARQDGRKSTAAGRYMFTNATWQDAAKALGLNNFNDPAQQDLAAVWLLDQTKAGGKTGLQQAEAGNTLEAARAGASRWEAIAKIGPTVFAERLPSYRMVEFGVPPTSAPAEPGVSAAPIVRELADTTRLATKIPDELVYPARLPAQAADDFGAAMDRAHAEIDQRLVSGTPESFTVNPLRRLAVDFGWDLPQQANTRVLNIENAADNGLSFNDWENNMRQFFGAGSVAATDATRAVLAQQPAADVETRGWQNAANPLSEARAEANSKMFGPTEPTVTWPTGLTNTIDEEISEQWANG